MFDFIFLGFEKFPTVEGRERHHVTGHVTWKILEHTPGVLRPAAAGTGTANFAGVSFSAAGIDAAEFHFWRGRGRPSPAAGIPVKFHASPTAKNS